MNLKTDYPSIVSLVKLVAEEKGLASLLQVQIIIP